ncbi:MAG TPA: TrmH family RNA methyltransferase [bacterium]|nr:TrmH family RNA methyltransferase [bacterium]
MSITKQLKKIIESLKNIFRYAMFNYKRAHTEKELNHYVEIYKKSILEFFVENKRTEEDFKKYAFLNESVSQINALLLKKEFHSMAVLSNNLYHKISETSGIPINEIDYVVIDKDKTSDKINAAPPKINIILDNIRSPFNVGSIFRTAESTGKIDSIYLCGLTPTPEHNRTKRSAMKTEEYVRWNYVEYAEEIAEKLKMESALISVETVLNSINYKSLDYDKFEKITLVFGNEEYGINHSVLNLSDYIINIEMSGKKNSLNVGVTAGIILFNIL